MNSNLSAWNQGEVQQWLMKIKMDKYITNFQNNQVNGYDLCYLSNDDFKELRINNFHDKNSLLKSIRLLTLEELKLNISYEQKNISVQLDFDPSFTVAIFSNELRDLFKINENIHLSCSSHNEILMPNLKIVELILLYPDKYKNLKIITHSNLKYNTQTSTSSYNPTSNINIPINNNVSNSVNYTPLSKNFDKDMNDKYSNLYESNKKYNLNYQQMNDNNNINNKDMKTDYQSNPLEKMYNREHKDNFQQDYIVNRNNSKEKDIYNLYKDYKQPMKIEVNDYSNMNNINNLNNKIPQTFSQRPYDSIDKSPYYNNQTNQDSLNKNPTYNTNNIPNYEMNRKNNIESLPDNINNLNMQRQNNFSNDTKQDFNLRDNKRYSSEKRNFRNNDSKIMSEMYNRLQEANNNNMYQKESLNNIPKPTPLTKIDSSYNQIQSNQYDSKTNFNRTAPRSNYNYSDLSNNTNRTNTNLSSNIINTKGGFSLTTNN